ncbi:flap endonuclease 1 isoform X2 [Salvia miltiorrhiza]|uniref:flap endonuclease 1 isoform X2 n=1 Tax=Salvia miltiorrhiza TaxID=226208 RepID=UPI0025ACD03E|nr:flap endonuclease 1 isoform X2 [Salvia miltiorrhiza]
MGIKGLTKLLAENAPNAMKEHKFESYFGREIAIDASMSIYQFLIVVGRRGTQTLTNEAGEVTRHYWQINNWCFLSHLQGMLTRTIRLLEAGIKPVYVFDGTPPDLKKEELAKRVLKRADATNDLHDALKKGNAEDIEKYSKRTVKATDQHYEDCKKLLRLMGVPVVEAPCEAESQCAALCKEGKVYAVASEDMDSLAFGAPRFLRHLMDPSSKRTPVVEFKVSKVLEELNLTMDQFIDLCILSGCDYCESIRGIGGLTALKLIRQHGSLEHILENINKERYQIPFDWPYQETRKLFREPSVLTDGNQLELKWRDPDEEGLVRFLVNENTFNRDRISKAIKKTKTAMDKLPRSWLESYSKPVGVSVPAKGEVARCSLAVPQRAIKLMTLHLGGPCGSSLKGVVCMSLPSVAMHTKLSMHKI